MGWKVSFENKTNLIGTIQNSQVCIPKSEHFIITKMRGGKGNLSVLRLGSRPIGPEIDHLIDLTTLAEQKT